ncbi:ImmA/IrrE family metallo-endopeptidase [Campylobacter showae]|uniref:ImmA/IrrE family metallo-endopeptidase n=1 Tax=Campylobacter showae TaxID=204 RepID=UPI0028EDC990|nr:ImmA/IrrE family metallo-endopeptidase [Campylobacter showae]
MKLLKWADVPAKDILNELNLTKPPFDPFEIARLMGVSVKNDLDLDKIDNDGMIYLNDNGEPEIWINPMQPPKRQIFTLAHELGHLVYHVLPNIDKFKDPIEDNYSTLYRNGTRNSQETLANRFAANLLMPVFSMSDVIDDFFEKAGGKQNLTRKNVIDMLVGRFSVSKDAIIVRLKQLGAIPQDYEYDDETKQKME